MNNMMRLLQLIRGGQNPQEYVLSMLRQQGQVNPMASNLAELIQKHDTKGIESLARNFMESQGKDFDKEFASFKKQMGL